MGNVIRGETEKKKKGNNHTKTAKRQAEMKTTIKLRRRSNWDQTEGKCGK